MEAPDQKGKVYYIVANVANPRNRKWVFISNSYIAGYIEDQHPLDWARLHNAKCLEKNQLWITLTFFTEIPPEVILRLREASTSDPFIQPDRLNLKHLINS